MREKRDLKRELQRAYAAPQPQRKREQPVTAIPVYFIVLLRYIYGHLPKPSFFYYYNEQAADAAGRVAAPCPGAVKIYLNRADTAENHQHCQGGCKELGSGVFISSSWILEDEAMRLTRIRKITRRHGFGKNGLVLSDVDGNRMNLDLVFDVLVCQRLA